MTLYLSLFTAFFFFFFAFFVHGVLVINKYSHGKTEHDQWSKKREAVRPLHTSHTDKVFFAAFSGV